MTQVEKKEDILRKLKAINEEVTELYDFIATIEALTTDKQTAARIRKFMEQKGVWEKI